jgi:UDP-GlcNAc:undecaprenyl-phosphate GlcNAc-1-phosphate transferase
LDDDPLKSGKKIQGYPILGSWQQMPALLKRWRPTGLLVSFSAPDSEHLGRVKALCRSKGIFLKRFEFTLKDMLA